MEARFGTDGVRGVANSELTPELALALGRAAARVIRAERFLIGRDTRRSGTMLQAATSAGLASEGADVVDLGVLPTPGVAWASSHHNLPGVVVSASHNPFHDNGVKLISPGGLKLEDEVERAIERELDDLLAGEGDSRARPSGDGVGRLLSDLEAGEGYMDHLISALEHRRIDGMRVVLDVANGASAAIAPRVLSRAGAEVTLLAGEPNGSNINDRCGSTFPENVAEAVVAAGAELGLALDGDADRLVAVDHLGRVVDGDVLLAMFAVDMAERGRLAGNAIAVTVMSNLGLHRAMSARGIQVRQTPVGDRHVLKALAQDGLVLGGEQSGHLVFRHLATTGDGILTALLLCDLVRRSGLSLADLAGPAMVRFPQHLASVTVDHPDRLDSAEAIWAEVASVEAELAGSGRVLLRASGTEPVVRVMVEAQSEDEARSHVERLCSVVCDSLGRQSADSSSSGSLGRQSAHSGKASESAGSMDGAEAGNQVAADPSAGFSRATAIQ